MRIVVQTYLGHLKPRRTKELDSQDAARTYLTRWFNRHAPDKSGYIDQLLLGKYVDFRMADGRIATINVFLY